MEGAEAQRMVLVEDELKESAGLHDGTVIALVESESRVALVLSFTATIMDGIKCFATMMVMISGNLSASRFNGSRQVIQLEDQTSLHPEVKWAQRKDKVFLTVVLPDAKDANVHLEPGGVFTFTAKGGAGNNIYELKLELFDKVIVEESKINYGVRNIFCILEKAEKIWWKRLLRDEGKPPHYVKVDWDKWMDEDEDENGGVGDLDLGGMDFSQFGGMGGMGGLGGMDGMDEEMGDDFEDSDDEEVTKPEEAEGAHRHEEGEKVDKSADATSA